MDIEAKSRKIAIRIPVSYGRLPIPIGIRTVHQLRLNSAASRDSPNMIKAYLGALHLESPTFIGLKLRVPTPGYCIPILKIFKLQLTPIVLPSLMSWLFRKHPVYIWICRPYLLNQATFIGISDAAVSIGVISFACERDLASLKNKNILPYTCNTIS